MKNLIGIITVTGLLALCNAENCRAQPGVGTQPSIGSQPATNSISAVLGGTNFGPGTTNSFGAIATNSLGVLKTNSLGMRTTNSLGMLTTNSLGMLTTNSLGVLTNSALGMLTNSVGTNSGIALGFGGTNNIASPGLGTNLFSSLSK